MTLIVLAPEIQEDFDRILSHLEDHELAEPLDRIAEIVKAINVLADNPLIGRPASDELRELVIGRRSRGYIALYRYEEAIDTLFILAIRTGREGGYSRDVLL